MKNESIGFNIPSSNKEDIHNFDQNSEFDVQSKNNEIFPNNFDTDLNISNIIDYETNEIKESKNENNKKNDNILNTDKSFEESFENFSKIDNYNDNINLEESEIQSEILANENNDNRETKKKIKKKRTKEDLNNTPLPVFECLYCTNEKVVFQHFITENLSEKYLLQTSIYDMNDLNKLILNKRTINNNKDEKLLNLVIKNTEYIKLYLPKEASKSYFKSEIFNNFCLKIKNDVNRLFKHKIEDSIVRKKKDFYFKGINKITKNSMNNKCLFNSTNSLINNFNALSGLVEPVQTNNVNNNIKNNNTIGTCSNNSINFNSLSLNNNEFNCYSKDNNNMLDYIVEKIEKNEESVNYVDDKDLIIDFFKFDLSRKINKKDIKWDNEIYNIWNPDINSDFDESEFNEKNEYNINKITNDTKNRSINMNINNLNHKYLAINKNLSNKSMGFIKYQKNKGKNFIFTFNKKKDKSKINKNSYNNNQEKIIDVYNQSNNIKNNISNDNTLNSNNNNIIIPITSKNQENKTKDLSEKNYVSSNITNKSISINNLILNKSQDTNKKISKQKNQIANKNTILNNRKNFISGISFLKSLGSMTSNNYNINKSANILGKSRKKINYSIQNMNKKSKSKSKNNTNMKSLQYMSNSKNSNASTNYSIGISINLKSNSSLKSNGFLKCLNYENSFGNSMRIFDENKSINYIKLNERKQSSNNLIKRNKLFNLFNNLNLVNFKQKYQRAKSNYKINNSKNIKKIPKSSKSINVYKNKNKKNNYNIYKKNKMSKQKIINFSSERQNKLIIPRSTGQIISSNSKRLYNNDKFYSNSMGVSIGSDDNNINENDTHLQFNSISNINKSHSNANNSKVISNNKTNIKNLFSPNKFNKTYYNNKANNKDIKNKLNDLIFMVNYHRNKNNELNHKNNMSDFKNKSINFINQKSLLKKQGYKSTKRFMFK